MGLISSLFDKKQSGRPKTDESVIPFKAPKQCLERNEVMRQMFQSLQVLRIIFMFTGYSYKLQLLYA